VNDVSAHNLQTALRSQPFKAATLLGERLQLKRTPRGAQVALVMLLVATVLGAVGFYYARFTLAGTPVWSTAAQAATWLTLEVALPLGAVALLLEGGAGVGRGHTRFRLFVGATMLVDLGAMLASFVGFDGMFVASFSAMMQWNASCANGTNTCLQPWVGDANVAGTLYLASLLLETAALIAMLVSVIRARKTLAWAEVESD